MVRRTVYPMALIALAATVVLWSPYAQPAAAAPANQTGELLSNPGLEADANGEYPRVATSEGGGAIAAGWRPWWYNDAGAEYSVPEYEVAGINRDPYRVHSGNAAQQLFRPSVLWKAGIYQKVTVPANAQVRFTMWGHAWSSFCLPPGWKDGDPIDCTHYHDSYWGQANVTHMKIGIDPTGGENWASPGVVWSSELNALDIYTQFSVEAQAQGETVTVFTYTTFDWPAPVNNVYWDDASLTVVGQPPAPAPPGATGMPPTSKPPDSVPPGSGPAVIPTQPPDPDGLQYHTVRAGETLGGIAVAYGTTSQQIRDLNGITGDTIVVGQRLLIRQAPPMTATPLATPTPSPTVEAPTATPQEVAEVPQTGKLCVAVFQDMNHDGLRDLAEMLVAGGSINLTGPANNAYTTDGLTEPFCFNDLPAGDYTVSVAAPSGFSLVAAPQVPITVSSGSELVLSFGVEQAVPEPAEQAAATPETSDALRSTMLVVVGVGAVLLLASLGGLAAYFFVFRKRANIE